MSVTYQYNYARIDETGMCIEVFSATDEYDEADLVEIPVYTEDYIFKYYINGTWYEDAAGTIEWTPAE